MLQDWGLVRSHVRRRCYTSRRVDGENTASDTANTNDLHADRTEDQGMDIPAPLLYRDFDAVGGHGFLVPQYGVDVWLGFNIGICPIEVNSTSRSLISPKPRQLGHCGHLPDQHPSIYYPPFHDRKIFPFPTSYCVCIKQIRVLYTSIAFPTARNS